ncbi:MAG: immunity protein 32 [Verrucomicrobia bacterium]|nr:immunity protein 32 [Verrucomicrobiota bacterium]
MISKNYDHFHLMTAEWGGSELSDEKQSTENEIINHVKIFKLSG